MPVKLKSTINVNSTVKKYERNFDRARMMVKSEIVKDSNPYTPKNKNGLIQSVTPSVRANDKFLIWNVVYARFLNYGKVMVGTVSGSPWAKKGEKKVATNRDIKYRKLNAEAGPFWFEKAKKNNLQKWLKILSRGGR